MLLMSKKQKKKISRRIHLKPTPKNYKLGMDKKEKHVSAILSYGSNFVPPSNL